MYVLDDNSDEWLDEPRPNISRTLKKVMWIAETCLQTCRRCHFVHLRRKDSSPKNKINKMTPRDLENRCATMVSERHAPRKSGTCKTPLCLRLRGWEKPDLSRRCGPRREGDAVKAKFVAQQVAYKERDDIFAGTPPLSVARTLLALIVLIPLAGIIQPGQGLWLRRARAKHRRSGPKPTRGS